MLDISTKYGYIDKSETYWRFSFESLGDDAGWFAWVTRPGQREICIGKVLEKELIEKLKENPPPLDQGDLIDLEMWLLHGGFEAYTPREKKVRVRKKKEIIE